MNMNTNCLQWLSQSWQLHLYSFPPPRRSHAQLTFCSRRRDYRLVVSQQVDIVLLLQNLDNSRPRPGLCTDLIEISSNRINIEMQEQIIQLLINHSIIEIQHYLIAYAGKRRILAFTRCSLSVLYLLEET